MRSVVVVGAPHSNRALPHALEGLRATAQSLPLRGEDAPRQQLDEWLRSLGEDPANYEERHGVWFRRTPSAT
jgi:hypothetical protein